ncbi:MAG: family 43 glycosylhydrolase [Prolixibacteraceae bacterium]|jgi:arabinan endo-1,5-alpha-L-arabinosidase|nr:family 43 glycosylhydrolase [Prolixibacteraceae bacterium]
MTRIIPLFLNRERIKRTFNWLMLLTLMLFAVSFNAYSQSWRAGIHDPSSIVKCKDKYWVFGTGDGIHAMYSTDLVTWSQGPSPFTKTDFPDWINNYVGGATNTSGQKVFSGNFWAPDIIYMNNQYYLYYSCSEWGTMTSTIGCVTNKTLDPDDPNYEWVDVGFLGIWSYQYGLALNAIDPAITRGNDGKIWMVYGSFNEEGIVITELDSISGKPKTYAGNLPGKSIANSWTGPRANDYAEGEGACMIYRDGYYYLFYNKGGCCAGINSSYYVVMGRSTSPKGPFFDKDGSFMRKSGTKSGGTVVFRHDDSRGNDDRYYGPGHIGVYREDGVDYVSFHYYDPNWPYPGQPAGGPTLGLAKLEWGEDGWPSISMDFVEEGVYTLKNANSNKMLDVQSHQAVNNALTYQYSYNDNYDSQKWLFEPLGTGEYTIRNFADTTLYLEAAGANNDDYLRLTSNYTGAVNQKFRTVKAINDKTIIYPSKSDKLIEIPYAYTTDYQVKLWVNTNHDCQRWLLTEHDVSVSASHSQSLDIEIAPNPVNNYLFVNGAESMHLTIYNLSGNKLLSKRVEHENEKIDVSELVAAPYILQIISNDELFIKKFIKE